MKNVILILLFNLTIMNLDAQDPNTISDDEMQMIKQMGYQMGSSFFSQKKKQPLSTEVDQHYSLPWETGEEENSEELEKTLIEIEESLSWKLDEFFGDKNLSIVTTYVSDGTEEVEFDKNFKITMVDYSLKDESGQAVHIKSDNSRAIPGSDNSSSVNGVTTMISVRNHQFDLQESPEKITGEVNLKMGFLSLYDKVMLTKENVGETFQLNQATYKLLSLKGRSALLEVIEDNGVSELEYVCTNENGLKYLGEFSEPGMSGGSWQIRMYQPSYDFFSAHPEGDFKEFEKYFDENQSRFMSAPEKDGHHFIGITNIGEIHRLYLYTRKYGVERQVKLTLD